MEKKQKILESRKRLDNALSLPDLVNEDSIASLVKEQFIQSSLRSSRDVGKILESRTTEVANFLEMLRSASGTSNSHLNFQKDWKVKQDTDQLRVMYCEGPHGSPFHTLLAEGFADGPMDVCLCVSWESTLYKKWANPYDDQAMEDGLRRINCTPAEHLFVESDGRQLGMAAFGKSLKEIATL